MVLGNTIITPTRLAIYTGYTSYNFHTFYGLKVDSTYLGYQVSASGADHVFYVGNSDLASSTELLRIKGTGIAYNAATNLLALNGTTMVYRSAPNQLDSLSTSGTPTFAGISLTSPSSTPTTSKLVYNTSSGLVTYAPCRMSYSATLQTVNDNSTHTLLSIPTSSNVGYITDLWLTAYSVTDNVMLGVHWLNMSRNVAGTLTSVSNLNLNSNTETGLSGNSNQTFPVFSGTNITLTINGSYLRL